jgi:hypothetical protein
MKFITQSPLEVFFTSAFHRQLTDESCELLVLSPFLSVKGAETLIAKIARHHLLKVRLVMNLSKTNTLLSAEDPTEPIIVLIKKLGKRIEIRDNSMLHAKAFVARGFRAMAGSSNLTAGGLDRNLECNFLTRNQRETEELAEWFERIWMESSPTFQHKLNRLSKEWDKQSKLRAAIQRYTGAAYHIGSTEGRSDWDKVRLICNKERTWSQAELNTCLNQQGKFKTTQSKVSLLEALGILIPTDEGWRVSRDAVRKYGQSNETRARKDLLKDLEDLLPVVFKVRRAVESSKKGFLEKELIAEVNRSSIGKPPIVQIRAARMWLISLGFAESVYDAKTQKYRIVETSKKKQY